MYRKEIYNMSPSNVRSFMAWNALLHQVVQHAKSLLSQQQEQQQPSVSNSAPFASTAQSIGATDLTRLDPNDTVAWSQVIHRMATNLSWLSDRAGELAALQVTSITHSVV